MNVNKNFFDYKWILTSLKYIAKYVRDVRTREQEVQ